ncbi:carbohydrate ABC transporter permease [Halopiger goleimassiliensis]|uniref:carbohydrate ABC transporter permease n=1 Tax=Halopiger goleimassiliensis TaxID=1293048 RepID=UPI0009DBABF7
MGGRFRTRLRNALERGRSVGVDLEQFGIHAVLVGIIVVLTIPIGLAFLFSTQTAVEVYEILHLAPGGSLLENYLTVWTEYNFGTYMRNSLVMTVVIIAGKLSFSLLAATALVYYDVPYQRYVFYVILFTLMLPIPVRIVPLYQLLVDVGWANTFAGLTAPYIASATAVFLFRQRFRSIPASVVETAKLDGVGPIRFLVYVLVPMSKGMIAGVTVIMFISMWNKYLWPLVVINDQGSQVVQVGLRYIQGAAAGGLTQWNLVMAGAMMALLPPLVVLIVFRNTLLNTFGVQRE